MRRRPTCIHRKLFNADAEEYLAERAQELRDQRLTATSEVLLGSPAATLLDAIRPDDLVVMTTHGTGRRTPVAPRQRR